MMSLVLDSRCLVWDGMDKTAKVRIYTIHIMCNASNLLDHLMYTWICKYIPNAERY